MLEPLLNPGTVAIIGASRNRKKIGYAILDNLIRGGFEGEIVPVNANADSVQDRKSYRRLKDYSGEVDLALICVPAQAVEAAVEEAVDAGVRAVVVVTAGFKEIGAEGAEREERIQKLCQDGQVHLLGPRSLGVINTCHRMNASFAKHMPKKCGMSVLSESGAVCTAILDLAAAKHLGLSKVVAIGNKAGLTEIDFFRLFAEDDETNVVVVYLESICCGDEFIMAAEQLAAVKPVVILRAGTTGAGARAIRSHTGSVPGEEIAYAAAFKRAGVVQAESLEALFDYAAALAMQPLPRGDRVAIVSNAGGPCVVAADALEQAGLQVAVLQETTTAALRDKLPLPACINNPIDVLGDADPDRFALAVQAAQEDDSVDAIIMIMTPHAMTRPAETARAAAGCIHGEKPMLAVLLGSADAMPGREDMVASGLPDYPTPERAVKALWAMREYAAWRARPARVVTRFPVNRRRVERLIARQRRTGRREVGEVRAKEILRAYDFTVPEGMLALDAYAATDAAERIGYPVAMKIVSPDIIHKSDAGGVKLRLSDAEQVLDAYDLLTLRFARHAPDARLEGIYVEKMCPRGLEVVIGMRRDPQFGPIMLFGLGGIFVEALKDEAGYLAPITAEEAMQMLSGTRSYELLAGARGQPGVDTNAIARGLQRISQLATDFTEIDELEINPFIITAEGSEPIVVDARMVLAEPQR